MPLWKTKDGEVNMDKTTKSDKKGDRGSRTFLYALCWLCECMLLLLCAFSSVCFSSAIIAAPAPVELLWDGGHTHSLVGACFCLVARL